MRPRASAATVVMLAGGAVGAGSVALARAEPAFSLAGRSTVRAAAELLAGYGLIAAGALAWRRRPEGGFALLLAAAGFGWFIAEWNNPNAGSALVFTVGLVLGSSCAAFAVHAVLAFPEGRAPSLADPIVVGMGYAIMVVVLGLLPAIVFSPGSQGCSACPRNLVLVDGAGGAYSTLERAGLRLGLVWTLAAAGFLLFRLWRSTPARRRLGAVVVPAVAYLGFLAADLFHSLQRGFLSNDSVDRELWLGQALALSLVSVGVFVDLAQARRTRNAVARVVVELAASPSTGTLRDALSRLLDDPVLRIAYRLDDGTLADEAGRPVELEGEVTEVVRGGLEVARIAHRAGVLDDRAMVEEVSAAARLAFENERLQAEVRAQLERLRASRARIVEAGDAERRRLERDLHDGAQQRLVALSLALALVRGRSADGAATESLVEAEREVRAALAELRRIANGIFPASLAEEGLPAALAALVEETDAPVVIGPMLEERIDPRVEAAAYFAVVAAVRRGPVKVSTSRAHGLFVLELDHAGDPGEDLRDLEDRVGALDGRIALTGKRLRAEIPCG